MALLTAAGLYAGMGLVLLALLMAAAATVPAWRPALEQTLTLSTVAEPMPMIGAVLLISLMAPAVWLAVALTGRRRPGSLLSVTTRMGWPRVLQAGAVTLVVLVVFQGLGLLLTSGSLTLVAPDAGRLVMLAATVVLVTVLQSVLSIGYTVATAAVLLALHRRSAQRELAKPVGPERLTGARR